MSEEILLPGFTNYHERLQRNFEGCMEEIAMLEKEKTRTATVVSVAVGIIGTAFLAGAVFAVTAVQPMILLCILLSMIEKKHDEIGELMKKGQALL